MDLKFGEIAEQTIKETLVHQNITVEVKRDRLAKKTGNLFFETWSRGKMSGINTTKADWFVIVLENLNILLWFRTLELKKRLRMALKNGKAKKVDGGDKDTSKGILIKIQELIQDGKN